MNTIPSACPDCTAIAQLVTVSTGLYVLEIAHDKTCPELHRKETKWERRHPHH